ncbi:DUF3854 domain-containing protein [Aphanothece minutissima]|uniref:SF3 helicase domain-containing protein n=1 Tax=Aphanothece cf. minutissima CCALA 015 TaxID=2107695 RepID=A0ABX5F8E0_9CHRO|nr:DUF3854 domain-containing protein [Aphanothece minutissima]PSB37940.1 hypothetical protein C7B81_07525 [Aphanothece cf. minutissima CCALA 015]
MVTAWSSAVTSLTDAHRDELRASALSDDAISLLRWFTDHHGALVLPYLRPDGTTETCRNGRPFTRSKPAWNAAQLAADPKPPKYLSPKGNGCRPYHSHQAIAAGGYPDRLANIHVPLRITEGEKKTEAATLHDPGRITVGIGGISSWQDTYDGGDSRPLVELEEIPMLGRRVIISPDSDVLKDQVYAGTKGLAEYLKGRGAAVRIERWPNDLNGDRLGLDDLIHRYGASYFLAIAAIAHPAFFTKGKGEKAVEVFNLPEEPSTAHGRGVYFVGMVGRQWRQSSNGERFWHQWTGTHWSEHNGHDRVESLIERFLDAQGWKRREFGVIRDLRCSLRRSVDGPPPPPAAGLVPFSYGALGLTDRALVPHDPNHGNRWCLPFPWQQEAAAPRIEAFLLDRLGDPSAVAVWRAFAQSLLTGSRPKAFVEITGPSDGGKSVVARLLEALVGGNNVVSGNLARLEDGSQRFETARFRGARLAVFPESGRFNGSLETLKAMTGGDPITAEIKGSSAPATFIFGGGVLIVGNSPMQPADNSGAVITRRRSLRVDRPVPAQQQRLMLEPDGAGGWRGELAAELPGLAAWVLAMDPTEARAALSRESGSVARREAELLTLLDTDTLAEWADQFLVWDPDAVARVGGVKSPAESFLLPHYRRHVEEAGGRPLGEKFFKVKLIGLLRDTLRLPLPAGSPRDGSYRDRTLGSLLPYVRLRGSADEQLPGVVTFGSMHSDGRGWKSTEGEMGKTQSSDGREGRDRGNQLTGLGDEVGGVVDSCKRASSALLSLPSHQSPDRDLGVSLPSRLPCLPSRDGLILTRLPSWAAHAVAIRDAEPSLLGCQVANVLMARHGIDVTGQRVNSVLKDWDTGKRP